MFTVNRGDFIAWTQGDLMSRDRDGRVVIGDRSAHEEAERRIDNGETIGLLDRGVLVSTMRVVDGAYTEEPMR